MRAIDPSELPADVLQAVRHVQQYFASRGILSWQLAGIQSREITKPIGYAVAGMTREFGQVHLIDYAARTESELASKVMGAARREGYKGTYQARMKQLGWEVVPVFVKP